MRARRVIVGFVVVAWVGATANRDSVELGKKIKGMIPIRLIRDSKMMAVWIVEGMARRKVA